MRLDKKTWLPVSAPINLKSCLELVSGLCRPVKLFHTYLAHICFDFKAGSKTFWEALGVSFTGATRPTVKQTRIIKLLPSLYSTASNALLAATKLRLFCWIVQTESTILSLEKPGPICSKLVYYTASEGFCGTWGDKGWMQLISHVNLWRSLYIALDLIWILCGRLHRLPLHIKVIVISNLSLTVAIIPLTDS